MKMKDQLDSPNPMKKHKAKTKKTDLKKKKQAKLETKKQSKEKKNSKAKVVAPEKKPIPAPKAEPKKAPEPVTSEASVVSKPSKPDLIKPEVSITSDELASAASSVSTPSTARSRASKSLEPMSKEDQLVAVNQIIKRLLLNEISQGMALRELRVNVLGLRQEAYTELTGVSRKTLSEIENDKGNYTPEILNKVFAPFELKSSLVPTSSQLLIAILSS
jgi:DNA-binding XRE family transcriptional regulator